MVTSPIQTHPTYPAFLFKVLPTRYPLYAPITSKKTVVPDFQRQRNFNDLLARVHTVQYVVMREKLTNSFRCISMPKPVATSLVYSSSFVVLVLVALFAGQLAESTLSRS